MSTNAAEMVTIEADVAERVIRYLGTKPYREVVIVVDHLKKEQLPKNLLTPTLNYIVRDDAAYSFAALQKVLIDVSTRTDNPVIDKATTDTSATNDSTAGSKTTEHIAKVADTTTANDKDTDNIQ